VTAQHGIVEAALAALTSAMPLDLCAHLDDSPAGAQLYLGVPALGELDATAAYRLFGDLRTALDKAGVAPDDPHAVEVDGMTAIAIATVGAPDRRVTVAARRDGVLSPGEVDAVTRLARALALLDPVAPLNAGPVRVSVEATGGMSRAVVTIGPPGAESTGIAQAAVTAEAVARAALEAVGAGEQFQAVGDATVGGERAVVVVVHRTDGEPTLGASLAGADPLRATATAALAAVGKTAE
jgi:hypothetical protein